MSTRRIEVNSIARLEGEGSLKVRIEDGMLRTVQLNIFEPPRLFEALLRGRHFQEVPDITARICGICPIAYQMSSVLALESALGVDVAPELHDLRRLIYCGEWIESHVLHIAMLHLPDFFGVPDGLSLAEAHPEIVQNALRLKAAGNQLLRVLGGREIHPVNVCVGGFYKVPPRSAFDPLRDELAWGLDTARELLTFASSLDFPVFTNDWELLALQPATEYPFNGGPLATSTGLHFSVEEYDQHLMEFQVPHSTALHSRRRTAENAAPLQLGPLARLRLNHDRLTPQARQAADAAGVRPDENNPFRSLLARAVEVVFACEEALRILDDYRMPKVPRATVTPRTGEGFGASEAPRGTCHHHYGVDENGLITSARIVPPTAVNQTAIESDLHRYLSQNLDADDETLRHGCERVIRNYDPCISCSVHFLELDIQRG